MKKIPLVVFCFSVFILQSCLKDKLTHTYTLFIPVYKSKDEVYANIKSNPPRTIESPGKIFLYGNYVFLNETDKGVHIIDNSDPAKPVEKAFAPPYLIVDKVPIPYSIAGGVCNQTKSFFA